ncbi:hypothetical protein [Bacillus tuaregi]|uniref:hypothetical protein n=1 Tax=Bacillus tuaregi TaxID=1816695 RepID=UPI0008F93B48|nr:hypothetical protein [Bacillus tuaregi]
MGSFIKKNWGVMTFGLCLVMAAGIWSIATKMEQTSLNGNLSKSQATITDGEDNGQKPLEIASEPFVSPTEFIQKGHQFYNDTAGWGRIESLNWGDQQKFAQLLLDSIEQLEENEALQKDFSHIQSLAIFIVENSNDKDHVLLLHRIFHDLDIDFNQYEHEDYFDVTQYGEGKKIKEVVKHIKSNSESNSDV